MPHCAYSAFAFREDLTLTKYDTPHPIFFFLLVVDWPSNLTFLANSANKVLVFDLSIARDCIIQCILSFCSIKIFWKMRWHHLAPELSLMAARCMFSLPIRRGALRFRCILSPASCIAWLKWSPSLLVVNNCILWPFPSVLVVSLSVIVVPFDRLCHWKVLFGLSPRLRLNQNCMCLQIGFTFYFSLLQIPNGLGDATKRTLNKMESGNSSFLIAENFDL